MSSRRRHPETGKYADKIDIEPWRRYLAAFDELIIATSSGDQGRIRIARLVMYHELWRGQPGGRS